MSPSFQAATSAQYFTQMSGKILETLGNTQVITTDIRRRTETQTITHLIPTDGHIDRQRDGGKEGGRAEKKKEK